MMKFFQTNGTSSVPSHPETGNPEKSHYIVTLQLNEVVKDQDI